MHFFFSKLITSVANLSILNDFCHIFSHNVHLPFSWQRVERSRWKKGVIIIWFCVQVSAKSVTMRAMVLCKKLVVTENCS